MFSRTKNNIFKAHYSLKQKLIVNLIEWNQGFYIKICSNRETFTKENMIVFFFIMDFYMKISCLYLIIFLLRLQL